MMSCILVFYLAVSSAGSRSPIVVVRSAPFQWRVATASAIVQDAADPDTLYAKRDDIANAQQAAKIWQSFGSMRSHHNRAGCK